jgi:hypothetical protein
MAFALRKTVELCGLCGNFIYRHEKDESMDLHEVHTRYLNDDDVMTIYVF